MHIIYICLQVKMVAKLLVVSVVYSLPQPGDPATTGAAIASMVTTVQATHTTTTWLSWRQRFH